MFVALYAAPCLVVSTVAFQNKIKNLSCTLDWLPDLQDITVTGGRLNVYNSLRNMQKYYDIKGEPLPKETVFISTISPNPTTDIAEVQIKIYQATCLTLNIFNGLGQQVHKQSHGKLDRGTHRKNSSLGGLPKGIYFVTAVADSFGAVDAGKIIVEQLYVKLNC